MFLTNTSKVSINGNKSCLVPWLGDISNFDKQVFDMLFGHFDSQTLEGEEVTEYKEEQYIEDYL